MAKAEQAASGLDDEKKALLDRAEAAEAEVMSLRAALSQTQNCYETAVSAATDLKTQNAQLQRMLVVSEGVSVGDRPRLVIISRTPGFRRGGVVHPARAEYPLNAFSADQLAAFRREPELNVIEIGGEAQPNGRDDMHGPGMPFRDPANFVAISGRPEVVDQIEAAWRAEKAGAATAGLEAQAARDMVAQTQIETGAGPL